MKRKPSFLHHSGFRRRLNTLFIIGVACGFAWLFNFYNFQIDLTSNNRNTLSPTSQKIIASIKRPITIEAYLPANEVTRQNLEELIKRYLRYKSDINFSISSLDKDPEKIQEFQIQPSGGLIISLNGRQEKVDHFSESAISNSLLRLTSGKNRWLFFLEGHGERSPLGVGNHDYGQLGEMLENKGFKLQTLNLAKIPAIPENIAALIISHPETPPLDEEIQLILQFVEQGGNVLWLNDPTGRNDYPQIADYLGIHFLAGLVVDATGKQFGINDPSFALLTEYPDHPVTQQLKSISLFPKSLALGNSANNDFTAKALLNTQISSWTETSALTAGTIQFDPATAEQQGPLTIAFTLTRALRDGRTQRIGVFGDGDFLSNAYIGNGGNLDLGINLMQWLSDSDQLLNIPARTAPDMQLQLTEKHASFIGLGFLIVLPVLLILVGSVICIRRRHK